MSPIEEKVTGLLAELATARPVEVATPPTSVSVPAGRDGRPDYVAIDEPVERARRRPVLVAAVVVLVVAVVAGLLVIGRGGGGSPVVASRSDLPVDTSLLGDGRMAVVVENQLHVADGPTGQVWQLTDTGRGEEVSNVSFSHDGEWVAFTIHDESGLWISRWDGSERHRIGRAPSTYAWSTTDDQLAYATQDEVRIARTDGTSRALTGGPTPLPYTNVAWSPDGQSLAFTIETFPGDQGALMVVTPQGGEDSGWGRPSQYTTPAGEVVDWPSDGVILLAGQYTGGASRTLQAALLWSVDTEVLLGLPTGSLVATSPDGSQVAAHLPGRPSIERCDLVTPSSCGPSWLPPSTDATSAPVFSPDGTSVAILGQDIAGRLVLTATDRPAAGQGLVLSPAPPWWPRYGTVLEPPQWLDDARLLVRTADGVDVVDVSRTDAPRSVVVEGERFLPPADDYPGGTGLAYWSPR